MGEQIKGVPEGLTEEAVPQVQGVPEGLTEERIAAPVAAAAAPAAPPESHWYTGVGDTLGREVKEAASGVANFPASVLQTWTTPATKEEESQPYSPYGILKHVGLSPIGLTAQRMVSDPLMEAYRFYAPQAIGGRAEPDIAGQMLSAAPEGMGQGASNAIMFGPGGIFRGASTFDPVATTQATVRTATRGLNTVAPAIASGIGGEIAGRAIGLPPWVGGGASALIGEFAPGLKNFRPLPRAMEQWGLSPADKLFQGTKMFKPEVGEPVLVTPETKVGLEKGTIKGADLKSVGIGGKKLWFNPSNEPRLQAYINRNGTPWNVPVKPENIPGTNTPATAENWAAMEQTMTGMMKGTPTPYGPQNVAPPITPESPVAPKITQQEFGNRVVKAAGGNPKPPAPAPDKPIYPPTVADAEAPRLPTDHTPIPYESKSGLTSYKVMPETGAIEVMKGNRGYRYAVDPEDIKAFEEAVNSSKAGSAWTPLQRAAGEYTHTWNSRTGKWDINPKLRATVHPPKD